MTDNVLSDSELESRLESLNEGLENPWIVSDGKLYKSFTFANFIQAFGFMSQTAIAAEKMDHHPEWCNVYKTVTVHLITHSSGGISGLDLKLAAEMEAIANP